MRDKAWKKIFEDHNIEKHDFDEEPYVIKAAQIKSSTRGFKKTVDREVRTLCKQDSRENRPEIFKDHGLFLLPIRNGVYCIIKGEGYVDIPEIKEKTKIHKSNLDFELDTSKVGNSEMQHLDYFYAFGLLETFMQDETLTLTVRGRKYTPKFEFYVGEHRIQVEGVQTEVDAGYEGRHQVVLIEAKRVDVTNIIIRQLYYPYRQWQHHTKKKVKTLFFGKHEDIYYIWQFEFKDPKKYNSIELIKSAKFKIEEN